jgi:hypothetical protein
MRGRLGDRHGECCHPVFPNTSTLLCCGCRSRVSLVLILLSLHRSVLSFPFVAITRPHQTQPYNPIQQRNTSLSHTNVCIQPKHRFRHRTTCLDLFVLSSLAKATLSPFSDAFERLEPNRQVSPLCYTRAALSQHIFLVSLPQSLDRSWRRRQSARFDV